MSDSITQAESARSPRAAHPARRTILRTAATAATALACLGGLAACADESGDTAGSSNGTGGDDDKLTVFATTGYLADAAKQIAPDAEIITLVGPGGDPHTYQPTTQDIDTMRNSDVVLWNGLHLEAQMDQQLESLGDKQVAVGDQLDESKLLPWPEAEEEGEPEFDPHIWNSPELWQEVVDIVADHISEIDPDGADAYQEAADKYNEEIAALHKEAEEALSELSSRFLVTGHDAFNYLGDTYDLDVEATDFVSTEAEKSATELDALAEKIAENKVPTIFYDNQVNPQAINALSEAVSARGWKVTISDEELFADSLGAEAPVDTYLGAFRHNVEAIAAALK